VLGAAFGPQVLLALFWKRASRVGAIGGMMTGVVVALGWKMGFDNSLCGVEVYNLPLAFIAALGANAVLSLAVPDTPSDYTSQGG
jgi:sodium/proline symporter